MRQDAIRITRQGLGDVAGGFLEEFVDEGLVGLALLCGHAAGLADRVRRLFGI